MVKILQKSKNFHLKILEKIVFINLIIFLKLSEKNFSSISKSLDVQFDNYLKKNENFESF